MAEANWKKSTAKQILQDDIIAGRVTDDMNANQVYQMHDEYRDFPIQNFRANLKRLLKTIEKLQERMRVDCEAYGHDKAILMNEAALEEAPPFIPWHRSEAKRLLKEDIENNKHKELKPRELWATKTEYQAFSLETFRKHIYQEVETKAKRAYRFAKKNKKEKPQSHS